MTLDLIALICFLIAAVIAGVQRAWALLFIAAGLALLVLHDLPIHVG